MDNFDLLSGWLNDEDVEVKIHHMFGSDKFEFRINYEIVDLRHLAFFSDPLWLCQNAAKLIDADNKELEHPVAGRILTKCGAILFQFFPCSYGFSATLSSLSPDKYAGLIDGGASFHEQLKIILGPGWNDAVEDRFTKFELLCDNFVIRAQDTLEAVREIEKELTEKQNEGPGNAGGHMSDHYTWYQNGLNTCDLILAKYGR